VEGCWRASKKQGRTWLNDLNHRYPGQRIGHVHHGSSNSGNWRNEAHKGNRHNFDGNAPFDTVKQILAGVGIITEHAGRSDGKNAHGSGDQETLTQSLPHHFDPNFSQNLLGLDQNLLN
jgi:hypothetical protein